MDEHSPFPTCPSFRAQEAQIAYIRAAMAFDGEPFGCKRSERRFSIRTSAGFTAGVHATACAGHLARKADMLMLAGMLGLLTSISRLL